MKTFFDFAEIEDEVRSKAPAITYKYRDWGNVLHRSILTDNIIWFSHPKALNDPYDIRVPVKFNFTEVDNPLFYEKLKYHAQWAHPNIPTNSREFDVICENQFEIIKQNPKKYFEDNYNALRESDMFDIIGVFSLSQNPLNEAMWAHYGNNEAGFCIGFDTVELVRNMKMGFGSVSYEDSPPLYSFIKDPLENKKDELYLKNIKWSNEEEFRILTLQIKKEEDRAVLINSTLVKEIILGRKISDAHKQEIIKVLKDRYKSNVKLFQAKSSVSSYGFEKEAINY